MGILEQSQYSYYNDTTDFGNLSAVRRVLAACSGD